MRRRALAVAAVAVCIARAAYGDPAAPGAPTVAPSPPPANGGWHVPDPWQLTLQSGHAYEMPPAHILPDPSWDKLDAELKRLQDEDTRLTAENNSLHESLSTWQPGWMTWVFTLAGGVALGWYAHEKL